MTPLDTTTRRDRQLRIARKRGDRLAVAVLEGHVRGLRRFDATVGQMIQMTETELRALWGDR